MFFPLPILHRLLATSAAVLVFLSAQAIWSQEKTDPLPGCESKFHVILKELATEESPVTPREILHLVPQFRMTLLQRSINSQPLGEQVPVPELTQDQLGEAMALTSRAFRAAAQKVAPSLVTIESFGGVSAVQGRIGGIRSQGEGNSTGLMLTSDGIVITSTFNFIQRPPVITVITSDGERRVAHMLGRDDTRKICLLKIDGVEDMPIPELIDPDSILVGQWAVSIGVGYGDTNPAVSIGIISAKNRVGGRAIQTDANISPANYGGPLVDIEGRVIGICVPMNPQSPAIGAGVEWYDSGIGFVIPLYDADKLLSRLKKGERIYPAFLGVRTAPNDKGDGIFIEEVVSGSPADKAGLVRGDRIISLEGHEINDIMGLKRELNRFESGHEVEIGYVPDEQEDPKKVTVKLGRPPLPKGNLPPLEVPIGSKKAP